MSTDIFAYRLSVGRREVGKKWERFAEEGGTGGINITKIHCIHVWHKQEQFYVFLKMTFGDAE